MSSICRRYSGSTIYITFSGAGGGGGGQPNYPVAPNAPDGLSGAYGIGYYLFTSGTYSGYSDGRDGQAGGIGSLGGGGGGGGSAGAFSTTHLVSMPYYPAYKGSTYNFITAYGGGSGKVDLETGITTPGEVGEDAYYAYASAGSAAGWYYGGDGGAGGESTWMIGDVSPIFFHYNGTQLANPVGYNGSINGGEIGHDSLTVYRDGLGINNFSGYSPYPEDVANAPSNVQDVIGTTPEKLGVSYNPAPPINLEFAFTDATGANSVIMWKNPDYNPSVTGYSLPDGFQIIGYNVSAYIDDPNFESEPETKYYTTSEVVNNSSGQVHIPFEDAKGAVSYWAVSIVIQKGSTVLESPTTVLQTESPLISVMRKDDPDHGGCYVNLVSALAFIIDDDWVGTKEEQVEYQITYLANYVHNTEYDKEKSPDQIALEEFKQSNTHLIFGTDLTFGAAAEHKNRYTLYAHTFGLPKDESDLDTDDNIKVTFENFRTETDTIITYGSDFTIEKENLLEIDNIRSVPAAYVGSYTMPSTKTVTIEADHTLTNINLDNGQYAPQIAFGYEEDDEEKPEGINGISVENLTGASRLLLKSDVYVEITDDLTLPYYSNPNDDDKNGQIYWEGSNAILRLKGDSSTNEVGGLWAAGERACLEFTSAFDNLTESDRAPLKVLGRAQMDIEYLEIYIENSHLENTNWIRKDVIQFTSLSYINLDEYFSSRLYLAIDQNTTSIEIWNFKDMRIEVTFPNNTKVKFPTYEESVDWIHNIYPNSGGTFTITLINDYDRLGIGGSGLDSYDNIALRSLTKPSSYFVFTSSTDPDTGEPYKFVTYTVDDNGQEEHDGYNDTFCLPENTGKSIISTTVQNMNFAFVENIYMGHGLINMYGTIYYDQAVTYYGAYDMSIEDSTYESHFNIIASQSIGLTQDGEIQGVGLIGFKKVTNNAYSKLYLNEAKRSDNYATNLISWQYSEQHYLEAGIYQWGTINNNSAGINVYFDHAEAIIYSYGTAILGYAQTLNFPSNKEAVNRDLYVFFDADGNEITHYTNVAIHTLATDVAKTTNISGRDNIIYTNSPIAVVAPGGDTDDLDKNNYFGSMQYAAAFLAADERTGLFELLFTEDYQVTSLDNLELQKLERAEVSLDIQSRHRNDVYLENIRYTPIENTRDEGEFPGFNKVKLEIWSVYERITLPALGNVEVTFNNILWENTAPTSRAVIIYGGSAGYTVNDTMYTTEGDIDLFGYYSSNSNLTTHDPYIRIESGEYRNVYGANVSNTTITTGVVPKIYLEEGIVKNLYGGASSNIFSRETHIYLQGGEVTDLIVVGNSGHANLFGRLYVETDYILPEVRNYDLISFADGITVEMSGRLLRHWSTYGNWVPRGIIEFGSESQLHLFDTVTAGEINTAGQLKTTGVGASLVTPRMTNGAVCLQLDYDSSAPSTSLGGPDTQAGTLTIVPADGYEYVSPEYDGDGNLIPDENADKRFRVGDIILYYSYNAAYNSTKYAADISHYNNGFFPLGLTGDGGTGYVYLSSMPITMAKDDGVHEYYTSIAAAMDEVARDIEDEEIDSFSTDYTIIIREQDYTVTALDVVGLSSYSKDSKSLTITGTYELTDMDSIGMNEKVGQVVTRKIKIGGDLNCHTTMYFDNIVVEVTTADSNIFANGHPLYIGTNKAPYLPTISESAIDGESSDTILMGRVEVLGVSFPNVYGGEDIYTSPVENTHVELGSGTYNNVYGGGKYAKVTGDTYLQLGNDLLASITGADLLLIKGDVYGGGYGVDGNSTGAVDGHAKTIIYGATFDKSELMIIAGGGGIWTSTVGSAELEVINLQAPDSKVYVSASDYGAVKGDALITVPDGASPIALEANIYGVQGSANSYYTTSGSIGGDLNIRIHGGQGANSIIEWRYGSERKVTGAINITLGTGGPGGGIGKEDPDSDTKPLEITLSNTSGGEVKNKLWLGLKSRTHNSVTDGELARVGDDLLDFGDIDNAISEDYLSAVDRFEIANEVEDPSIIEFGASDLPEILQTLVEHKDADGVETQPARGQNSAISTTIDGELNTVMKTLHFAFQNNNENEEYNGFEIESAYVSTSNISNPDWISGGEVPVDAYEVTLDGGEGQWTGKTSLNIKSYGIDQTLYYAHVRDERGSTKVILLDVHSPIYIEEPVVEQVDGGDYHITLTMTDPKYDEAIADGEVTKYPYTASGLYMAAAAIGTSEGTPAQIEVLMEREMVLSDSVFEVRSVPVNTTQLPSTAVVPKELLEGLDPEDTVIYLFIKDNLGNVREVVIPLSTYAIDVSIPTRVGMIAVNTDNNRLLAPQCFVVNNGNNAIKVEVVGADINGGNEIEFLNESDSLGENKIRLVLSPEGNPLGYGTAFANTTIPTLNASSLHIGDVTSVEDGQNAAYFGFKGDYNAGELDVTGDWSLFTMKYRFTVLSQ